MVNVKSHRELFLGLKWLIESHRGLKSIVGLNRLIEYYVKDYIWDIYMVNVKSHKELFLGLKWLIESHRGLKSIVGLNRLIEYYV